MREDHRPRGASITGEESQEQRGLGAVRIGQMKAEPEQREAKQRPNEAQHDDETNATTDAVFSIGGRNRAVKLLLLPLFWNLD